MGFKLSNQTLCGFDERTLKMEGLDCWQQATIDICSMLPSIIP
jgi:hypothetical protein